MCGDKCNNNWKIWETIVTTQESIEVLNIQYVIYILEKKNFIPVLASNVSAYDYDLITPIIAEKFKECNFLHVGENLSLS